MSMYETHTHLICLMSVLRGCASQSSPDTLCPLSVRVYSPGHNNGQFKVPRCCWSLVIGVWQKQIGCQWTRDT